MMKTLESALGKEHGITDRAELSFETYPAFTFLGVYCRSNENKDLLITKKNYQSIGQCNPLSNAALTFSAPVLNSEIKNKILFTPDLAGGRKDYDPWANYHDYSRLGWAHKKGRD